ncbi:hypothetical protein PanWU01x14_043610 [Parasponia andersonii]|uniref:Uncharacterized protein n=1 Tax=Parasponia andersonii TaxID=3476 RepID=A0A2P5DQ14_PARAD|nr:hypothetical protein PanWU01x14_043610 [Parasponia andersonii]
MLVCLRFNLLICFNGKELMKYDLGRGVYLARNFHEKLFNCSVVPLYRISRATLTLIPFFRFFPSSFSLSPRNYQMTDQKKRKNPNEKQQKGEKSSYVYNVG